MKFWAELEKGKFYFGNHARMVGREFQQIMCAARLTETAKDYARAPLKK